MSETLITSRDNFLAYVLEKLPPTKQLAGSHAVLSHDGCDAHSEGQRLPERPEVFGETSTVACVGLGSCRGWFDIGHNVLASCHRILAMTGNRCEQITNGFHCRVNRGLLVEARSPIRRVLFLRRKRRDFVHMDMHGDGLLNDMHAHDDIVMSSVADVLSLHTSKRA